MKDNDSPPEKTLGTDWQILGELKLSIDAGAHSDISIWMAKTLSPLNLHEDFINKILKSARDVVTHAMQTESGKVPEHLHLSIFVSQDHGSSGRPWGFFRVEKLKGVNTADNDLDHAIEFYLYLEGQ